MGLKLSALLSLSVNESLLLPVDGPVNSCLHLQLTLRVHLRLRLVELLRLHSVDGCDSFLWGE